MKSKTLALVLLTVMVVSLTYMVIPIFAQPGDANDPLVTRRYVDERFAALSSEIATLRAIVSGLAPGSVNIPSGGITTAERDQLFAEIMLYFETVYGEMLRQAAAGAAIPPQTGAQTAEVVPFTPLFIPAGRILVAEAGVEIILRSGQATVIAGPNGLVDITAGLDIANGEQVSQNHLLLVPASDGRGMLFNTDAWIMIKGGYTIVNQ